MNEHKYMCCFCGESIGESTQLFHRLDPCAIVLVGNWRGSRDEQIEQQFFCHLDCFRNAVDPQIPVALERLTPSKQ